jgi:hypothetical protein
MGQFIVLQIETSRSSTRPAVHRTPSTTYLVAYLDDMALTTVRAYDTQNLRSQVQRHCDVMWKP